MPLPSAGKYGGAGASKLPTTQKSGSLPSAGKYGTTGSTTGASKGNSKKKGFIGFNLPKLPFGGPDLPAIGVTTDKHNPVAQVSNLVTGFVPGLVKSVYGLSKEAATAVNPVTSPINPASHPNTGTMQAVQQKLPLTSGLVSHAVGTAKVFNPADIPKDVTGNFGSSALGKRVKQEGVLNTIVGTAADLSLLAGGAGAVGRGLGAGKLAEAARLDELAGATSRAAGLGAKADEATLAEAATKAAASGDAAHAVDLDAAAKQVQKAQQIRDAVNTGSKGAKVANKVTAVAEDVAKMGGHVANAPAKPFELLAKGVTKGVGSAAGALDETALGRKYVTEPVRDITQHVKDRLAIADLYHRSVTSPSQQALFRNIENGESAESIRTGLKARFPDAGPGIDALANDIKDAETNLRGKIPKGEMGSKTPNLLNDIRSKTPTEWEAEIAPAAEKLKAAKAARSALPDGDPGFKAASKAVTDAQREVTRLNAMHKMSMVEPDFIPETPPPAGVAEALQPETAKPVAEPATLEEAAQHPNGPSLEEVQKFHKENVKALQQGFHAQMQEKFAPGLTAEGIVPDVKVHPDLLKQVDLGKELSSRGYVAWDPETGQALKAAQIRPDSPVLPEDVFKVLSAYTKEQGFGQASGRLLKFYDATTGKFKHTVLALSPRWHMGNVVGNLMMGMAAGLSPLDIIKFGNEARKMVKAGESPPELLASGYHFSEQGLANMGKEISPLKHPIAWSYNMNQYVDDVNRTMIYLAKKAEGVSAQAAVGMALKAAGDFGRMSPFEKNYIKRIVPFWAWQKHITQLAFRLPIEDPARVAWTMHLSNEANQVMPDDNAGGFNKGTIGLGGMRLDLRAADPFGSSFLTDPSVKGLTRQLNPLLSLADIAGTGHTLSRGNEVVRTPDYQFGQTGKPLGGSLPNFGKILSQQIPQVRQAQDLVAGQSKTRLDTGDLAKKQYPEDAQNRWQQLLKIAGVNIRPNVKKPTTKTGS